MEPTYIVLIISLAATLIIGIIGFFLKRSVFSRADATEAEVVKLRENSTTKEQLAECKNDIKQIREDYTPKEAHQRDIDKLDSEVRKIKEDYITKEDFYREQAKTDRKLDRIVDILLEMKGEKNDGK